ncbi:MAG: leucine-rich repeat domain-containing protein [Clostridia bacterium]|nr:leucine-rich repeat domain-containing protein [Clostridia bacterium]
MKKFLYLIIALFMLSACVYALAESEAEWEFDTYSYSLEGYSGQAGDLVIPDVIQDCTVDILGLNAFNSNTGITSLVLPGTLRQIENGALSFCEDLVSLTLNDGLLVIGDNCICGNSKLEEVTIPASVCYIGATSFTNCENLRKITFSGVCPVFDGLSFDWLPEDAVIYVPDDQYDAYYAAFEAIGLWPNLQMSGAFAETVDFSSDPSKFGIYTDTGMIFCFEGYDVRVDVPAEIDGVKVRGIEAEAFKDMPYMCYVTLPEGVEVIGDSAFEGCNRLLYVDFPSTLRSIGSRAFAGGVHIKHLDLPEGLESMGSEAFHSAMFLSDTLDLPEGLKTIGDRAFADCSWMSEVYIPASVETIGENAFGGAGISYVVFEGLDLPEMPASVFADCNYLSDIDLHTKASKQQMLDIQAVVDGLGLDCRVWRIQNPDVDYVNDYLDVYENGVLIAYTGTQSHLRPWDTYDDIVVTAVGDGAFKGNTTIEYFAVPYNDAFTTIGAEAFAGSTLRIIDLFDSVTTIGDGAFRDCTAIEEILLPESVTSVGMGAFSGCTGLKKLTVLCDPSVIPAGALEGCSAELEIYASESATDEQLMHLSAVAGRAWNNPVTRIGETLPAVIPMPYEPLPGGDFWYDADYARLDLYSGYELNLILPREIDGVQLSVFGGSVMGRASWGDNYDTELPVVSVVIPETYTEIVPYAFSNCETLETVICYAPIEALPDCAFQNCTALREVIFVNGVHTLGANVFDNCPSLETVYLGQYLGSISDQAFLNIDGTAAFDAGRCITDPALMPDVDALLANVKRDPMPAPEPEPAPAPAVSVGEEGAPFFGLWTGVEMDMGDGILKKLSDFEMVMTLMLSEDGRAIMSDGDTIDMSLVGDGDWYPWRVEDGAALCEQYVMTITEDGRLCLNEEGMKMYFVKAGEAGETTPAEAPAAEPAPEAIPESTPEPVVEPVPEAPAQGGMTEVKYVCVSADMEGYTIDASMLGGEYSLVFHDGGAADFVVVGSALPGIMWEKLDSGNFQIDYYGTKMEIVWTDTGFDMNYFDTMLLHFVPAA